jgi:hypothetical protein
MQKFGEREVLLLQAAMEWMHYTGLADWFPSFPVERYGAWNRTRRVDVPTPPPLSPGRYSTRKSNGEIPENAHASRYPDPPGRAGYQHSINSTFHRKVPIMT